jgi:hypothetical protein
MAQWFTAAIIAHLKYPAHSLPKQSVSRRFREKHEFQRLGKKLSQELGDSPAPFHITSPDPLGVVFENKRLRGRFRPGL